MNDRRGKLLVPDSLPGPEAGTGDVAAYSQAQNQFRQDYYRITHYYGPAEPNRGDMHPATWRTTC